MDEKFPRQRRQASPFHAEAAVCAKTERMERDVACASNAARLLKGVDSVEEGVLGGEAVGRAAGLGGARDSALRGLSSALPGPRSHLRCLPAERRPPELCFQKTTVWRVKPGERRVEPLEIETGGCYNRSVKRCYQPKSSHSRGWP